MRLKLIFASEGPVDLPWEYPYFVYGAIVGALREGDPTWAVQVHDRGFVVVNPEGRTRRFKGFCFSPLRGRQVIASRGGLRLMPPISFMVASPLAPLLEAFLTGLFRTGGLRIRDQWLPLGSVECLPDPVKGDHLEVRTASAVVVSTGVRRNGKLIKRYLAPTEPAYRAGLRTNLREKYAALLGTWPAADAVAIDLQEPYRSKLHRIPRTGGVTIAVRGWLFRAVIRGDPALLRFALDVGLGENTALGFGFLTPLVSHRGKNSDRHHIPHAE